MNLADRGHLLRDSVRILKGKVSKTAYQGVLIAISSIVFATGLVSYYHTGQISVCGFVQAQTENVALWMLDGIPFVFAVWGQYSSSAVARQAGVLALDQMRELRIKTEHLEKQSQYAATHDELTSLPNRALFYSQVERAIFHANQEHRQLSVLLVQIENFKDICSTLGWIRSDLMLQQISIRLQRISPDREKMAKIDGNLFGILLNDIADIQASEQFARIIQKAMEQSFVVDRHQFSVHSNIGIVHFPEHGVDVDALIQRAGVALDIAQTSNTGYAIYEASLDTHSPRRLTLMSELRHALNYSELELFYQAKISVQTGKLEGAEALVRWHHPQYGFISPDEFIGMAESTRMITQLTLWAMKQVFLQCANWYSQGLEIKISMNLSTKDLHDPELPDRIADAEAKSGIKPEWVILEITEGAVMNDPERALEIIERLHDMGYRFSIDDYGTGYSSLAYLKKIPLAELKIDKSFVKDILISDNDAVIVKATINLAHNLGLQVTAEGVESQEILDRLKEYGCDLAQGYYLSNPLSVADFDQWLRDSKKQAANRASESMQSVDAESEPVSAERSF